MPRILVIGATGNIGREVVAQLPAATALVRNPAAARLPGHVTPVAGDLTRPETLDAALDGVDSVFLVWTAPPDAFEAALARIAARARRLVFVSAPLKTPHPLFQQPNLSRTLTERYERLIEASGIDWTFLRPGMLASNAVLWWSKPIRAGEVVRWPYLDVPTAPIHPRDIAAIAVRALSEESHTGAEYVLTGPEAVTHLQQIAAIGDALNRLIPVQELSPEEARTQVFCDWPAPVVNMLMNAWEAAAGQPAFVSSTVEEITGRPARSFREWASDHKQEFGG